MVAFYLSQLDYIIFLEGLFLLALGVLLCFRLEKDKDQRLPWFWLGMFFIVHGVGDWVNLIALSLGDSSFFLGLRWSLMFLSVFFLFIFARKGCIRLHGHGSAIWVVVSIVALLTCVIAAGLGLSGLSLYLIPFFMGGLWAAFIILHEYKKQKPNKQSLFIFGVTFSVYVTASIAGGSEHYLLSRGNIIDLSYTGFLVLMLKNMASGVTLWGAWKYSQENHYKEFSGIEGKPRQLFFGKALIVASLILLTGWYLTEKTGQIADKELRQNLLAQSKTAASSISQERVLTLTGTSADNHNPNFDLLRNQLATIRVANTKSRFVYLLQYRDGEVIFLADGEPEYSSDYSPPGQVYEEASTKLLAAFINGEAFIEGPYTDRWGSWVSGHAPIKTLEDGLVIAMLGMDINAKEWPVKIAAYRLISITSTLVVFLAAMFFFLMRVNRIEAEKSRESEERYRKLFNSGNDAIIVYNIFDSVPGRIIEVNEVTCNMLGYSREELRGFCAKDIERPADLVVERLLAEKHVLFETVHLTKDGRQIPVEVNAHIFELGEKSTVLSIARDISERKRISERMQYLATHDPLTDIPNRYLLEEGLKRAIIKAKRGKKATLLFIDVDNFKLINDTYGHSVGDQVLISLGGFLKERVGEEGFLARLGGDEFAILLEEVDDQEAEALAEELRSSVDETEVLIAKELTINMSISIGIVMIDGTLETQKLLSHADVALFSAKEWGRNRVVFVQPEDDSLNKLLDINEMLRQLKNALREERFILYFQPVCDIETGKTTHYEALIRMIGKDGEVITPNHFIPVAERFGLMAQIDKWVIQTAVIKMKRYPELSLFINLSGTSLGDDYLLESIERNIKESGISPSRIGFEITETAVVKDLVHAEQWIQRLKTLGCSFALDDFGRGFSSFSYLQMLPVDYIKIDGSYIRNLNSNPTHRALVQAISTVAKTLGKKTVAEFVEDAEVMNTLKGMGVDYGQGYYIGKPAPLSEDMKSVAN